ncbi:MAG TPA: hypothetical protein DHW14_06845 [Clostridiales bacterium]|nr:hypothetical protein [Clostridiales bacterium]
MTSWLWVTCAVAWLGLVVLLRVRRLWLPYYVLATVGFSLLVLTAARRTLVETTLEALTAQHAHVVSGWFDIPTRVFKNAPGTLLVLVVIGKVGWTVIEVGIECSGLLELTAFTALILFYPGLRLGRRSWLTVAGLVATYLINILRLLVIIAFLHWGGKDTIFVAHTIIGRGLFFLLVVAVYWSIFTRAALKAVRERVEQA